MLPWEYTERITVDLGKPILWHYSRMFLILLVVCRWPVAPLLSFPSIQSHAKGLLQYYDSIITLLEEYADFQKHTSLLSLSSQRENTCWALDWKYEHIVNVLSQSINNNKLSNWKVNFSGTLIVCFHLISLPLLPALSLASSVYLSLSLSLIFMNNWIVYSPVLPI